MNNRLVLYYKIKELNVVAWHLIYFYFCAVNDIILHQCSRNRENYLPLKIYNCPYPRVLACSKE